MVGISDAGHQAVDTGATQALLLLALVSLSLGIVNLLAWRGAEGFAATLAPLTALVGLAALVWLFVRPGSSLARGGLASLVGIVLAPSLSADAVAAPLLLLALAALVPRDEAAGLTDATDNATD